VAVFLNNGVQVTVAGVNLSDHVTSVTLNRTADELEVTAMGDSSHKFVKGLEAPTLTIDFLNDTATSNVLQTLQAAYGTTVTVTLKQTSAATAPTNPLYTMSCLVNNLTDINGSVADIGMQSVTWTVNSAVVITTA
jgi:hypothetical protein